MTKSVMTALLAIYILTVLVVSGLVVANEEPLTTQRSSEDIGIKTSFDSDIRPDALFAE